MIVTYLYITSCLWLFHLKIHPIYVIMVRFSSPLNRGFCGPRCYSSWPFMWWPSTSPRWDCDGFGVVKLHHGNGIFPAWDEPWINYTTDSDRRTHADPCPFLTRETKENGCLIFINNPRKTQTKRTKIRNSTHVIA